MDAATAATVPQMSEEQINAYFQARDKALSAEEVLERFHQSYHQVLAALEEVDEARLFAPYGNRGMLLVELVRADTAEQSD
jgi:hypothetical protein